MRLLCILLVVTCCSTARSESRKYRVSTSDELTEAIQKAEPGAKIILRAGRYHGPFQLERDITIQAGGEILPGETLPRPVILDSDRHGTVLMVLPHAHVELSWVNIEDGTGFGAAIISREQSTLMLHSVELSGNNAGPYALMEIEGELTIEMSSVVSNAGMALMSLGPTARVHYDDTEFRYNRNVLFATACGHSNIAVHGGVIETPPRKPFAFVFADCPTMRRRLVKTEDKLIRGRAARPIDGALPGVIDIDGATVNEERITAPPK